MAKNMNTEQKPIVEQESVNQLHIMKFGGSSVGKVDGVHNIGDIVTTERLDGQVVVVVSALNGTTDSLFEIADLMNNGEEKKAADIFMATMGKHFDIAEQLMMSPFIKEQAMLQIAKTGLKLDNEILDQDRNPENKLDRIASFGETLSTGLVVWYLRYRGVNAVAVDASTIVRTNSDFGKASPIWDETGVNARKFISPLLKSRAVPVVTGFCGTTEWGEKTIMERGGSDVTASVLARELGATRLTFYKDVDGVYDRNPHLFPDAKRYDELSLVQADQIAKNGNKVLAQKAIEPLIGCNIQVEVRSTFFPFERGTIISP